ANILGFAAIVTVNFLSASLPLNGKTPGQLSDQYPNLFVPAGLTFAIWGVIYLVLLAWVLPQVAGLFSQKQLAYAAPGVENVGWFFFLTCILNIAWLFAWHWEQIEISVVVMVCLLTTLIVLNEKIRNGRAKVNDYEKWLAHTAFGLYQGWITVALIANVTALFVASGWQGFGIPESTWAILMIATGACLAVFMVLSRNMIFHGLAVAWALLGIYLKRSEVGNAEPVAYFAVGGMMLVLAAIAVRWSRWRAY
ncbi:MAG TPA: hypothetical protein PK228_13430, partial [Saprospiraceae bacterium]|nr:hypothetical protein [Saprospiraceae bacterium]